MADPLSIAAAVVGLAETGFSIAKGLVRVANELSSAGREVRLYAAEIHNFSKLLELVHVELEQSVDELLGSDVLNQLLKVCSSVLDPFNRLQRILITLTASFKPQAGKWNAFCARIQWIFETKEELLFWRDMLGEQHKALHTALTVLVLQKSRSSTTELKHLLTTSLDLATKDIKATIGNRLDVSPYLWAQDDRESIFSAETAVPKEYGMDKDLSRSVTPSADTKPNSDELKSPGSDKSTVSAGTGIVSESESPGSGKLPTSNDMKSETDNLSLPKENLEGDVESRRPSSALVLVRSKEPELDAMEDEIQDCLDPDDGYTMNEAKENIARLSVSILEASYHLPRQGQRKSTDPYASRWEEIKAKGGKYCVGIICEDNAEVVGMRTCVINRTRLVKNDAAYEVGTLDDITVVIVCVPDRGYIKDLAATRQKMYHAMIMDFPNMLFTISVGLAGGIPSASNDIRLGDIIVGKPDWDGNTVLVLDGPDPGLKHTYPLPEIVVQGMNLLACEHEMGTFALKPWMTAVLEDFKLTKGYDYPKDDSARYVKASCGHSPAVSDCPVCAELPSHKRDDPQAPLVHFGTIGSLTSNPRLEDASYRDQLGQNQGILCCENEGAYMCKELPMLVVRGVVDYCDKDAPKTRLAWKRYAAYAAATYASQVVTWLSPGAAERVWKTAHPGSSTRTEHLSI